MDKMDGDLDVSDKLRDEKNNPETDLTMQTLAESPEIDAGRKKKKMKAMVNDEIQSIDQNNAGSSENPAEGNMNPKRKRRKMIKEDEKECTDQETESCARNELSLSESVPDKESPLNSCKDEESILSPDMAVLSTNKVTTELVEDSVGAECSSEDLGQYPIIAPVASVKRKLIVLDVNGLLANIVMPAPKDRRGDTHILGRAIFKRPFCDDFLQFCFQNFDVGVWSSRSKRIIERVVDYLLGDLRSQLLFCWDMDHSTQTGFKTLENMHKPLVCKELRRIWENDDPDVLWKKGDYDESNTLLLDDSPYKALLNPLHTAIFPNSYNYEDKEDKSLGPGGDLRVYLEGLLNSEHVQKYVEQNPFGQSAINETNLSWEFYSGVLQSISNQLEDDTPASLPTIS